MVGDRAFRCRGPDHGENVGRFRHGLGRRFLRFRTLKGGFFLINADVFADEAFHGGRHFGGQFFQRRGRKRSARWGFHPGLCGFFGHLPAKGQQHRSQSFVADPAAGGFLRRFPRRFAIVPRAAGLFRRFRIAGLFFRLLHQIVQRVFRRRFRRGGQGLLLFHGSSISRRSVFRFFGCHFRGQFFFPLLSYAGKPTLDIRRHTLPMKHIV